MALNTLDSLFMHELQDVYSAEQQILKALPAMIKAATAPELVAALKAHEKQTQEHRSRIETIFQTRGEKAQAHKCKGMAGVLEENSELLGEEMPPEVRDVAIVAAAQRVEHYEMAVYGCLRTYAQVLGDVDSAKLLQKTLDEEADADRKMTELAEFTINVRACEAVAVSR